MREILGWYSFDDDEIEREALASYSGTEQPCAAMTEIFEFDGDVYVRLNNVNGELRKRTGTIKPYPPLAHQNPAPLAGFILPENASAAAISIPGFLHNDLASSIPFRVPPWLASK